MKTIYNEIYLRLIADMRQARVDIGLTQSQLANLIGVRQSYFSKYEAGQKRLDIVELVTLCNILKLDVVEIVKRFCK